jgi:hypothetical protein
MPWTQAPSVPTRQMTDAQYEAAVRRWNHLGKSRRLAYREQCRREGHIEKTYYDARVCVRCLRYTYQEG